MRFARKPSLNAPYLLANHARNPLYHTERTRLHDRLAQWISDTEATFDLPAL